MPTKKKDNYIYDDTNSDMPKWLRVAFSKGCTILCKQIFTKEDLRCISDPHTDPIIIVGWDQDGQCIDQDGDTFSPSSLIPVIKGEEKKPTYGCECLAFNDGDEFPVLCIYDNTNKYDYYIMGHGIFDMADLRLPIDKLKNHENLFKTKEDK